MITAKEIAEALNGRKSGDGWLAHCPAHDDQNPSFFIREGHSQPLFHCYAGCSQEAVIGALKVRGLLGGESTPDDKKSFALQIWEESKLAENTLVQTYLESLGWNLPIPSSIRFHSNLKHRDGEHFPCMVALITHSDSEKPMAIHRTFLSHDGKGIAPLQPARMKLGACCGGVVRLGEPGETLMIGKEIEKCLSSMQEKGLPAWATLSSSLKAIRFPPNMKETLVLNDYRDTWTKHNFRQRAAKQGFRISFEEEEGIDPERMKVNRRR